MPQFIAARGKCWAGALAVGLALAAVVWLGRLPFQAWYCVRGLARAGEETRDSWVLRITHLGNAAVPALLECLGREDSRCCANVQVALSRLLADRGADQPQGQDLVRRLTELFPSLSAAGQCAALLTVAPDESLSAASIPAALHMLRQAAAGPRSDVHARALAVAEVLYARGSTPETSEACRGLVRTCLRDESKPNRLRAVLLALKPGVDLPDQVVPLLRDPDVEIRRAAMLAVGPSPAAIATDDLLRWLHDPDPEVRQLCEQALRSRGLQEEHLKIGRLMTDALPVQRLKVLECLRRDADLEPGVWLRYLSHDPAPAVRAAMVRAAAEQTVVDLTDRMEQMATADPSPTIRQLATYYLSCRKSR